MISWEMFTGIQQHHCILSTNLSTMIFMRITQLLPSTANKFYKKEVASSPMSTLLTMHEMASGTISINSLALEW